MKETIKVATLPLETAGEYMTGTLFETPDGHLFRVTRDRKGRGYFIRMTKRVAGGNIELKKGEERWR